MSTGKYFLQTIGVTDQSFNSDIVRTLTEHCYPNQLWVNIICQSIMRNLRVWIYLGCIQNNAVNDMHVIIVSLISDNINNTQRWVLQRRWAHDCCVSCVRVENKTKVLWEKNFLMHNMSPWRVEMRIIMMMCCFRSCRPGSTSMRMVLPMVTGPCLRLSRAVVRARWWLEFFRWGSPGRSAMLTQSSPMVLLASMIFLKRRCYRPSKKRISDFYRWVKIEWNVEIFVE